MTEYHFTTIDVRVRADGVAELALNRPKANAFNDVMMRELIEAYTRLGQDADVKKLFLFSKDPKFFSTGIDVKWLHDILGDQAKNTEAGALVVAMFNAQRNFPKPMVIAIDHVALGGGVEFLAAANAQSYIVGGNNMRLEFPKSSLGILPSAAMPDLIRKVGINTAMKLFSGFETPNNRRAAQLGLIHEYAPDAQARAEEVLSMEPFPEMHAPMPAQEPPDDSGIPENVGQLARKVYACMDDKSALDHFIASDLTKAFLSDAGKQGIRAFASRKANGRNH